MKYCQVAFARADDATTYLYKCYDENIREGDGVVMERNAKSKDTTRPIKFAIGWVKEIVTRKEADNLKKASGLTDSDILEIVSKINFEDYNKRNHIHVVCGDPIEIDIKSYTLPFLIGERLKEELDILNKTPGLVEPYAIDDERFLNNIISMYERELKSLVNAEYKNEEIECSIKIYETAIKILKNKKAA